MRIHPLITLPLVVVGLFAAMPVTATDFATLPAGEQTAAPAADERPDSLLASEKVDGIVPALPPPDQLARMEGMRYVTLFSTREQADKHSAGKLTRAMRMLGGSDRQDEAAKAPAACFRTVQYYGGSQRDTQPWPLRFETEPVLHGAMKGTPAAKMYPNQGLTAVRVERLTRDGSGGGVVKSTEAWVDADTLGVRKIREDTLPLRLVAEGPAGLAVLAARDASGEAIHFVIHQPSRGSPERSYMSRSWGIEVSQDSGHSDCGYAHIVLGSAAGMGDSALMEVELELDPPAADEQAPADPNAPAAGSPPPSEPPQPRDVRSRALRVQLSLSQTATDAAPVPSVSFGWLGHERRMHGY
jgi:hypothetical protein